MSSVKLNGGYAIIVGAASGIGQETASIFAEAGAAGVLLADINETEAREAAEKTKEIAVNSGYQAFAVKVDVTDTASVQSMVVYAVKIFGRVDYCVNSAGVDVAVYKPLRDADLDDYDRVMNINTTGQLRVCQAVSKQMVTQEPRSITNRNGTRSLGRGCIINVASGMSYGVVPGRVAYVTSKHALLGITKAAALENASEGIRVNAVCPGWVETPMHAQECRKVPQMAEIVQKMSPLGRPAQVDEVAEAIAFLCSPGASYINGSRLVVDSGILLTVHVE